MNVTASKRQAATRQLDVAIELLLTDRDPLAARTLAAAAFGVLSDLVEKKRPGDSWREKLFADSGLPRRQAIAVLNGASNFLKHADRDSTAEVSFEEEENDHLIFFATIECGELGEKLSYTMQAFQIWYLACHKSNLSETEPGQKAIAALPGMYELSRQERLQRGVGFLAQVRARYENAA
jgi:hypothetical protein